MEKSAFISLINKYLDGTASDRERRLLEEYYTRLESKASTLLIVDEEARLHSIIFSKLDLGINEGMSANPLQPTYARSASLGDGGVASTVETRHTTSLRRGRGGLHLIYRLTAAAAAILILIGSYYLFFNNQPSTNKPPITAATIPPGRDAAILTLSNGKNISLDSLRGNITDESGTTAINSSGLLSYTQNHSSKIQYHTLTTARGNQYSIILPDGSKAMLNSATSIIFPSSFTGSTREIKILYGEAYFEITPNKSKPFIVRLLSPAGGSGSRLRRDETEGGFIEVLGTSFNINNYAEEGPTTTTLITGSIKLSNNNSSKILSPGQQAIYTNNNYKISTADIQKTIAWTTGFFEFDQMDLKSIMRQVSRWYDIDIFYQTTYPSDARFGGRISRNLPLSNILKLLEANGLKFRLEGKKLIIN